jgi:hypothetical protein
MVRTAAGQLGACFLKHLHERAAIFERSRIGIGAATIA